MYRIKWLPLLCLLCVAGIRAETILVIESYHAEYQWDISYKRGLERVLGRDHNLIYYEMDTKRLPESRYPVKAKEAWAMYKKISPDLVILADDNALKYLGRKFTNTTTPVVYLGINANPRKYGVVDAPNISGVTERPLLKRSIVMLQKILPIKKALVLLDSKETARVVKQDVFDGRNSISIGGIHIDVRLVERMSEWKQLVKSSREEGYDVLFAGLYQTLVDDNEEYVDPEEVIRWTSDNTPVPPFGFWDFSVGNAKSIGGYVIFGFEEGRIAAELALDMLAGHDRRAMPLTGGQGRFMFSRSQLNKWEIKLPQSIYLQAVFVD